VPNSEPAPSGFDRAWRQRPATFLVLLGVIGGAMAFRLVGFLGPTLLAIGYSMLDEWPSEPAKLLVDGARKSDLSTRATAARSPANTKTGIKE